MTRNALSTSLAGRCANSLGSMVESAPYVRHNCSKRTALASRTSRADTGAVASGASALALALAVADAVGAAVEGALSATDVLAVGGAKRTMARMNRPMCSQVRERCGVVLIPPTMP